MTSRNKIIFAAALVAPVFIFQTGFAQQNPQERARKTTESATTQVAQATTETKRQLTAEEKTALQERLNKRKAELKVRITTAEKQRLQSKCKNATGPVSSLRGRIKGIETSRSQVYENLVDRLTKLSTKLQDRNVDTTELDGQIAELKDKIATFTADLAIYKQAVGDLEDMDCAADVEAFKASLEAARAAREKVKLDIADIKAFVNDTVKPTLKSMRGQLEKQDGSDSSTSTQETQNTNEGDE